MRSLKDLAEKFGCSERTVHKIIAEEWFPRPIQLGPRLFRWDEDEIDGALAMAPRRSGPVIEPPQLVRGKAEAKAEAAAEARRKRTEVPA